MNEELNSSPAHVAFDPMHLCGFFSERSSQAMVAVEGRECTVRHVNAAFLRLAGVNRLQMMGFPFAQAVPEGKTNGCASLLERVQSTGIPETLVEQQHGATAATYWSYAVWPIRGKDRVTVGVMVQVTDSTEIAVFRQQSATMNESLLIMGIRQHELIEATEAMNLRLQDAIKEKEYFIAVLSHELRTPLAPVLMGASVLLQDKHLGPDARSLVEMIHRNIALESHLIEDLLDVSRMGFGKLKLDFRAVDLRGVLERAVGLCNGEILAGQIRVEIASENEPQIIQADDGRLLQVFSNLIRNAVKFTPTGGNILIRSRCEDGWCTVDVTDSGAGIDPEFLPRMFGAFEQRDKPHTRRGGLGLGLAICKMIVELHGGSITAKSAGKDRGTTFVVRFPAPADVIATLVQEHPPVVEKPGKVKPLRILLVEDHADTARIMSRILKNEGHTVQWAGKVVEALTLAAEDTFDLLLCDVGLPDGNGWDLMRTLRQSGSILPGIVLSGYGQADDIQRSNDAGFSTHLIKPLSVEKLRDAIGAIV